MWFVVRTQGLLTSFEKMTFPVVEKYCDKPFIDFTKRILSGFIKEILSLLGFFAIGKQNLLKLIFDEFLKRSNSRWA